MPLPNEKTIAFDLWPNLVMIEGPAERVGALIAALYDDPSVPRDAWNVSTKESSRRTYAAVLEGRGAEKLRQGMGIRTDALVADVQDRARAFGLSAIRFSGKSKAAI